MGALGVLRDEGLVVQLVRPVSGQAGRVQPLQLVVLLDSGAAAKVEGVHHVAHVHPGVVKGVALAAGAKVKGARHLLDKDKACGRCPVDTK